ncbi:hypothetical protein [Paenibacillus sp. FSL H3-0310]|uniref:hypothetical protein n=1 Tax=Paenibacillus sp. FSL H3-0310 TaxID=2921429 RepID=UPI0030FA402E
MSKKRFLRYGRIASLYLCSSVTCSSCYTFRSLSSQDLAAAGEPPLPLAEPPLLLSVPHLSLFAPVI